MYRSIWNTHIPPPPPPPPPAYPRHMTLSLPREGGIWRTATYLGWGIWPQHQRGGELDSLPRFYVSCRIAHKNSACLPSNAKAATPYPSVIIGEPMFNVADITFLFVTSGKTLETDISAQITSDECEFLNWSVHNLNRALFFFYQSCLGKRVRQIHYQAVRAHPRLRWSAQLANPLFHWPVWQRVFAPLWEWTQYKVVLMLQEAQEKLQDSSHGHCQPYHSLHKFYTHIIILLPHPHMNSHVCLPHMLLCLHTYNTCLHLPLPHLPVAPLPHI